MTNNSVNASSLLSPHMSFIGFNEEQTAGLSGIPKREQRFSSVKFTQRIPAGFPFGMPGIGPAIEMTMQHAPHPARHS